MGKRQRSAAQGKAIKAQARRALDTFARADVRDRPGSAYAPAIEVSRDRRQATAGPRRPVFGAYKGRFSVGPEFFEPLSEEELRAWFGE